MKNHILYICIPLLLVACRESYTPKPRGFYRIDLPEKEYQDLKSTNPFTTRYPFSYEYPVYATITPFDDPNELYWHNINFNDFNATINFSYRRIGKHKLQELLADTETFVGKHHQKASGIFEKEYSYPDARVFGVVYDIKGGDVASTYQFYLTDSVRHYVRGALYFMETPRNDSLAPVIEFLKEDIDYLIQSFKWNF